jgi:ABC-type transport system involved in multi-copper enzyme maturation permease subunit
MKYLAILKDSFREAIDTKVFYVMGGFSLLLAIVIASISFRPLPAEEAFGDIVGQFNVVYAGHGDSLLVRPFRAHYQVKDLQPLTPAVPPEQSGYRFELTAQEQAVREAAVYWDSDGDESSYGRNAKNLPDKTLEEFLQSQFAIHGSVHVKQVSRIKTSEPGDIAFAIETHGTTGVRGWLHEPVLFFGTVPLRGLRVGLGMLVYFIEDILVNGFGAWVGILVGVVITAFFIPNMLRKGSIDLLLAKPIRRTTLLVYKYIGGLSFVFLNAAIAIGSVWLVLGLRSGIWATGFLLSILIITFFFAIFYAVSTLFGVLTGSPIVSILMTCLVWFVVWIVGKGYATLDVMQKDAYLSKQFPLPQWVFTGVNALHYVLPRSSDLNVLSTRLVSRDVMTEGQIRLQKLDRLPGVSWTESLTVSAIFIAVFLGLASWRFTAMDY